MGWTELLEVLVGWVGRDILVSVSIPDDGAPMASLRGVLRTADHSPAHLLLQKAGQVAPDDKSLWLRIGDEQQLTLTRGRFREAGWQEGQFGRFLFLDQGGALITVTDVETARAGGAG